MLGLREGKVGDFEIKRRVISRDVIATMYSPSEGRLYTGTRDSDFTVTVLLENNEVWMSDSLLEMQALVNPVKFARGNVLVCGLGIGLFPMLISDKPEVINVDIVDSSPDVIELVFNQIRSPKMSITLDDMWLFLAVTSKRYDFIYMDIWQGRDGPLREADKALELAQRCLKPDGKAVCWLQELYDRVRDKLAKEPIRPTGFVGFHEPCLLCEKTFRNDYAGLCMDCADMLGVSEIFI